jgi:hypothetical protein
VEVVKNGTNSVAQSFSISAGESKIEFEPRGISKYVMKVEQISVSESTVVPVASKVQPVQANSVSFGADFGSDFTMGTTPTPKVIVNPAETQVLQQESASGVTSTPENSFDSEFSGFNVAPIPVSQSANTVLDSDVTLTPVPQTTVSSTPVVASGYSSVNSEELRAKQNELNDLQHSESRIDSEISGLEEKIVALSEKIQKLADNKKHLVDHMEKLQAEYNKDYSNYEKDVEEIKSKYVLSRTLYTTK